MYKKIVVGGTFDGLHKGHQAVLSKAFEAGDMVIIGLTSDQFVKKYKINNLKFKIREHVERRRQLEKWLKEKNWLPKTAIVSIDDSFEPAASDSSLEAIIATSQNIAVVQKLNKLRLRRGLPALAIIEVSLVNAADGKPISATRMRRGEIDREGHLIMPEALRSSLQEPLGKILKKAEITSIKHASSAAVIITVGDMATKTLLDLGMTPSLAIIDGKVGRRPYAGLDAYRKAQKNNSIKVESGPGNISHQAQKAIINWSQFNRKVSYSSSDPDVTSGESRSLSRVFPKGSRQTRTIGFVPFLIIVEGEEDLLTLPAIICAPPGSILYYGQPGQGLVCVKITPQKQKQVQAFLTKFTPARSDL